MRFSYLFVEGFKSVFKNKKSTTISLITMICAMFLFGVFFAIGQNINYILDQVQRNQGIEVFIKNEATDETGLLFYLEQYLEYNASKTEEKEGKEDKEDKSDQEDKTDQEHKTDKPDKGDKKEPNEGPTLVRK